MSKKNKSTKKIKLEEGFFIGIGEPYYEDERYYKKIEEGKYKLISMSKLLKECYPEKYKKFVKYEKARSNKYYKNNVKKITCECGCLLVWKGLRKHLRSKKHKKIMKNINEQLLKELNDN